MFKLAWIGQVFHLGPLQIEEIKNMMGRSWIEKK